MNFKGTKTGWRFKQFWNKKILHGLMITNDDGTVNLPFSNWKDQQEKAVANANLIVNAVSVLESLNDLVKIAESENWDLSTTGRQIVLRDARKNIAKSIYGDGVCFMDEITKDNRKEWIMNLNASGYAGIKRNGMICDRREFPDARPIPKNSIFGVIEPKEL